MVKSYLNIQINRQDIFLEPCMHRINENTVKSCRILSGWQGNGWSRKWSEICLCCSHNRTPRSLLQRETFLFLFLYLQYFQVIVYVRICILHVYNEEFKLSFQFFFFFYSEHILVLILSFTRSVRQCFLPNPPGA